MGKFSSRNKNRKNKDQKPRKERDPNEEYVTITKENDKLEEYYKSQKLVSEEEWPIFWEHLKVTLPTTFRITGTRAHAYEIRDTVKDAFVPHLADIMVDGVVAAPPKPLAWYPEELGWHYDVPRTLLKKSPEYAKFHQFLVAETEVGNISRQEAVSMIPPLLLDIQPQHWVMDMCAAPGSKTAQIIELVHSNDQHKVVPGGLILANDADNKRSHMLIHQTKRLQSPCLMVTNHDAGLFPNLKLAPNKEGRTETLEFDRVLADVPCSGDATLRKNPLVWKTWTHGGAMGLHGTQVNILQRGIQLLKVGGRIVYSTCSFNPMENEAVVAEMLNRANGTLELVDVSHELPALIRRPGLSDWKVYTKEGVVCNSIEELPATAKGRFLTSMWPPKNATELHLERCLRIYPHLQDTGGFFVAVFKKTAPYVVPKHLARAARVDELNAAAAATAASVSTSEAEVSTPIDIDTPGATPGEAQPEAPATSTTGSTAEKHKLDDNKGGDEEGAKKPRLSRAERFGVAPRKEEPFVFLNQETDDIKVISDFYGLDPDFPADQFLSRSEGEKNKTVYFVSDAVKRILQSEDSEKLKVVNTGVRTFIRQDSNAPASCKFRVHSEGIALMHQFISNARVIPVQLAELTILLQQPYPKTTEFSEDMQKVLEPLPTGCCIFEFDPALEKDKTTPNPVWEGQPLTGFIKGKLIFPVWKAQVSFNALLNKQERRSLASRLGVECVDSPATIEGRPQGGQISSTSTGTESSVPTSAQDSPAMESKDEE